MKKYFLLTLVIVVCFFGSDNSVLAETTCQNWTTVANIAGSLNTIRQFLLPAASWSLSRLALTTFFGLMNSIHQITKTSGIFWAEL